MHDRPVPKLDVSFTGTSHHDLTTHQAAGLTSYLRQYGSVMRSLHLGDCVRADEQMYDIACAAGLYDMIILHPPTNRRKRAFCFAQRTMRPRPYIMRNHMMVEACDELLAAPAQAKEVVRSGTWATIRHARRLDKHIVYFYP